MSAVAFKFAATVLAIGASYWLLLALLWRITKKDDDKFPDGMA
jgi:hypothetical protein